MKRTDRDGCPGVRVQHAAADGGLIRIRVPGGRLTAGQVAAVGELAADLGNGQLEVTSRANLQVRGVVDTAEAVRRVAEAGLLPSTTHEHVRNILASPLTGRVGGLVDVAPLVAEFDEALQRCQLLASLPGRILFGFDDGTGDVAGRDLDFGAFATPEGDFGLIVGGRDSGIRHAASDVVQAIVDAASAFERVRGQVWRVRELAGGAGEFFKNLGQARSDLAQLPPTSAPPVGWLSQTDGRVALGGGLPFGSFTAELAPFLAAPGVPVVLTPHRSVVMVDLDEDVADTVLRVLAPRGVVFDAASPWLSVTACVGRPACAKSLSDVRADAAEAIATAKLPVSGRQHWVGCGRQCGRSAGDTAIVATDDGYRVDPPRTLL